MKNLNKHLISLSALTLFAIFFVSSSSQKKSTTPLMSPNFDYSPPTTVPSGSAGVKLALFQPVFSSNFLYSNQSPFKDFRRAMGNDLEELISARGYIIKGPYEIMDQMVYADKKECELGVFVEIDLKLHENSGGWRQYSGITAYDTYAKYNASLNLSGKINIVVKETFTQQKLWIKSVPIPESVITAVGENKYPYGTVGIIPLDDPGVYNPLIRSLQDFYRSTLNQFYQYLVPEEMKMVQKQVPEIRKEAGFEKK